jgi:hypothetical protein
MVCGSTEEIEPKAESTTTHGVCDARCAAVFDNWVHADYPKLSLRQSYWERVHGEWNGA